MDVREIAHVVDHGHSGIRLLGVELRLRLLDVGDAGIAPRSELHEVQLQVRVLELLRPAVVERVHLRAVALVLARVVASLVPDEAADRHRRKRRHHSVPEHARLLLGTAVDSLSAVAAALLARLLERIRLKQRQFRHVLEVGTRRKAAGRRPGVDVGAAPAGIHQADGDLKRTVEFERKIVAHCRRQAQAALEVGEQLRIHLHPRGLQPEVWLGLPHVRHLHETHERTLRHLEDHRALAIAEARPLPPDRAAGVGLARAEPHLANQHVLDLLLVRGVLRGPEAVSVRPAPAVRLAAGNGESPPLARGRHRIELDPPRAVVLGDNGLLLVGEPHRHSLARVRKAPHANGHLPLQHHLVAKHRRQAHVSLCNDGHRAGRRQEHKLLHLFSFRVFRVFRGLRFTYILIEPAARGSPPRHPQSARSSSATCPGRAASAPLRRWRGPSRPQPRALGSQ